MPELKEQNFVSAVVYLSNDEKIIGIFLKNLDDFLAERFNNFEIIVVNDHSTDQSEQIVKSLTPKLTGTIIIINMSWRHGVELAMLAGTQMSMGDYIFEFEYPIDFFSKESMEEIYKQALNGYDIVVAVPYRKRKLSSRLFYKLLSKVSYLSLDLDTESFKVISRRALNKVINSRERIRYRKALYRYSGFPYKTVKIDPVGKDQCRFVSVKDRIGLAVDILFSFSDVGLKIVMLLSLLFFFISVILGIYALVIFWEMDSVTKGWTTLMLFLSFGFSGLFFVLGMVGKYLTIILVETQNRPNYVIESVNKIENER